MSEFISSFIKFCRAKSPSLGSITNLESNLENVISPEIFVLKIDVLTKVQKTVDTLSVFAHSPEWLNELRGHLSNDLAQVLDVPAPDSSVLMGYDFHYDPATGKLGLIEINTNCSMFLPCALLYEFHKIPFADGSKAPLEALRESFFTEWANFRRDDKPQNPRVAIVDEEVEKQKMYFEFLMYRDLFESWGWSAQIIDSEMIDPLDFDFIYNRFVDFYFSRPSSKPLLDAWRDQKVFISPHPREYLLLADKERLADFYKKKLDPALLATERIQDLIRGKSSDEVEAVTEDLWQRRKQLFFKPRTMYGGKAAYRGNGISRRVFTDIMAGDFIAQEFNQPAEHNGKKFDLRFFVYRNEIQNACARIYTGQTTNFNSPGGGLAPIRFE